MIGADPNSFEDMMWGLMLAASEAVSYWFDLDD